MFLHLGGIYTPHCLYTPIHLYVPVCLDTPICPNTPFMSPMLPYASVCSRGYLHVMWVCRGPYICLATPYVGCLPIFPTPPHICMLPYTSVCSRGYVHVIYGIHPICYGLGESHICQAFGVCQSIHWMSIMLHLIPFL